MSNDTSVQPKLSDLLARYLEKQADAEDAGITAFSGEVTPYEVGPLQPLDPKLAWDEALAALAFYGKPAVRKAPPHWAQLVAGHESIVAVAFCVGNFPQLVRNWHQVLTQPAGSEISVDAGRPAALDFSSYVAQAGEKRQFPQLLIALSTLRLARQFDAGRAFIQAHDAAIPAEWRAAWDNEKAALAWHAGQPQDARKAWDRLEPTAPVLFNRGMAALFTGDIPAAKQSLQAAVALVPAASAWHHLGRLYLTLAGLR